MNVKKEVDRDSSTLPMQKRLLSISEACVYLGLGKSAARAYLEQIGAKRSIGRRVLYDLDTIDKSLNTNTEEAKHDG